MNYISSEYADMQTCSYADMSACCYAGMQSCRYAVISYEEPESGALVKTPYGAERFEFYVSPVVREILLV